MYRTLKEFRQIEAEAAEVKINECQVEDDDPVGSNFEEPEEAAPAVEPAPPSGDFDQSALTFIDFSIGKRPESALKGPESPGQGVA